MSGTPAIWARSALKHIAEMRLPPTPENFAKFYHLASGERAPSNEDQAHDSSILDRFDELVNRAAAATDELAIGLGEHDLQLTTSVSGRSAKSNDPAELLRAVERLSVEIQTTVKASQAELIETRRSLDRIKIELEESRELSTKDPLTGLANRRGMTDILSKEIRSARRSGEPLSVVLLDLDHFKQINDTHGHGVGDFALVHFSQLATSLLRGHDAFVRFGGEEFLLILPETGLQGAVAIADRFRSMLLRQPLNVGSRSIPMTFSGGAAMLTPSDTEATLVGRADSILYQAKRRGRNCVLTEHADDLAVDRC